MQVKHVVVQGELRGSDIRPAHLIDKFRQLSIEGAAQAFGDTAKLVPVDCPACRSIEHEEAFVKHGFRYVQCAHCQSVYVSPRPAADALAGHRVASPASAFRAKEFTEATGKARRFHILRSHALWLGRLFEEAGGALPHAYADLGSNYPIVFEEIGRLGLFDSMHCIGPLAGLEDACRQSGARLETPAPGSLGALSAFEQMEHEFSPRDMLRRAADLLAPGGMLVLTTRTISGFDLQVLWGKTPYIFVPEHLNLLSVEGLGKMLEQSGFELMELSTPGQLDVELTLQALDGDPTIELPRFIQHLLRRRGTDALQDFQEFLQKNRLSSHLRAAATKK